MKQFAFALCLLCIVACSDNTTEKQKVPAYDLETTAAFDFKMIGEDKEENVQLVNSIQVIKKGQTAIHQTLKGFEAEVGKNEQVTIEDLNFDGQPDIRLMQFLPTDESIAYFYWLYDSSKDRYVRSSSLEEHVFSPDLDDENELIISQWRKKDGTFGSDYFKYVDAIAVKLTKQEENIPFQDTLYKKIIREFDGSILTSTKESTYKPESAFLPR